MKLVVGLGNPGSRYEKTRHNVGFRVIDALAGRWRIDMQRQKFSAAIGDGVIAGERSVLLKPLTFMNLSGQSVQAALAFYKLPVDELLVISDDLDLPTGRLRVRSSGSSGGQRGLESIIAMLGTEAFARVRIGIGRPAFDAAGYVLSEFSPEETDDAEAGVRRAADAAECWLTDGVTATMNRFNRAERAEGNGGPGNDG